MTALIAIARTPRQARFGNVDLLEITRALQSAGLAPAPDACVDPAGAHKPANVGDKPLDAVMVELKHSTGKQ